MNSDGDSCKITVLPSQQKTLEDQLQKPEASPDFTSYSFLETIL